MTRGQMLHAIAQKECDNYCENTDKLKNIIIFGVVGIADKDNNGLEELYEELYGVKRKITNGKNKRTTA